ncbi:hypothetical protein [Phyllobacterium sp. DC4000-4]|jgi:hypothetical protein|uniref:hypothetical protein n=1 Tax=unclassified Phyllobacterium TaxID=2638441 RepID=UPI003CF1B5BB
MVNEGFRVAGDLLVESQNRHFGLQDFLILGFYDRSNAKPRLNRFLPCLWQCLGMGCSWEAVPVLAEDI